MSNNPTDLRYSKEHQWARVEDDVVYVGITDYAQDSLGEVVYVDLPTVGDEYDASEEISTVESVKTTSSIYNPIAGVVASINEDLEDSPELINDDPYENYIYTLKDANLAQLDDLLSASEYEEYIRTLD
ncbi:MAG: glycine cleavage system protein GcvH [Sphaerochaetaceae bacterium]|jgi:glycine cleavage system H protein